MSALSLYKAHLPAVIAVSSSNKPHQALNSDSHWNNTLVQLSHTLVSIIYKATTAMFMRPKRVGVPPPPTTSSSQLPRPQAASTSKIDITSKGIHVNGSSGKFGLRLHF